MTGHQLLRWHVVRQLMAAPGWHLAGAPAEAGSRLMLTPSLPPVPWAQAPLRRYVAQAEGKSVGSCRPWRPASTLLASASGLISQS